MRELGDEKLEKAAELVRVSSQRRRQRRRVDVARLERAHVELQAVAELLDAAEHADRVPLREPAVEELDVVPHPRLDPTRRVDQLEREIRRARLRAQLALRPDRIDRLDDPILCELGDRHGSSLRSGPDAEAVLLASVRDRLEHRRPPPPPPAEPRRPAGPPSPPRPVPARPARAPAEPRREPAAASAAATSAATGRARARPTGRPARRDARSSARAGGAGMRLPCRHPSSTIRSPRAAQALLPARR